MSGIISGNVVGGVAPLKTVILTDENGNEVVGVVTESVQIFDATPNDVRINKTFVNDNGIQTGENTITYRTEQGTRFVMPGEDFILPLSEYNQYNYTELQCMIAQFNTSFDDSTAVDRIVLHDKVFLVNSIDELASVVKDDLSKSIDLNITNDSENIYLIYYFTYRQEEM